MVVLANRCLNEPASRALDTEIYCAIHGMTDGNDLASPALVEARAKGDVLIVEPGLQCWVEAPPFTEDLKERSVRTLDLFLTQLLQQTNGALPPNFVGVFGLTGGNLANALSALSGEAATGSQQVGFQLTNQFLSLMLDPFVDLRSRLGRNGLPNHEFISC